MMVRLTHIDGKLPNLALMKLSHWHKAQGHGVRFTKHVRRELDEPDYDRVYGSAIFSFSRDRVREFQTEWPGAIVGGTWNEDEWPGGVEAVKVEDITGGDYERYDYSLYPGFSASIGFTQRGCRLRCGFCCVWRKEGRAASVSSINELWRGPGFPKHLHILDNDFFGQPEAVWRAKVEEIVSGGFKVCMNQGINLRLIDDEGARAWATVPYYDDSFKARRLYTAWDNLKDERIFMRGVERLERAGIPAHHLMVYMLVGFDPNETWQRLFYRFNKMTALGIRPFPMVFNAQKHKKLPLGGCNMRIAHRTLGEFQRWVIRKSYNFVPFEAYDANAKGRRAVGQMDLFAEGKSHCIDGPGRGR
jgi:hypothetical protein